MTADDDLFVAAIAREMRDGDRVFIGINQPDVTLAACMARSLWAPRLRFWASGTAFLDASLDRERVGRPSFDGTLVDSRETFFWQARAFEEMGLRSAVCFAGGLQVDQRGNVNLAGITNDGGDGGWRLRGPGSAGLPSLTAWAERFFVIVPDHSKRALVETCSTISVVGDPVRRAAFGMPPASLVAVITPMARFEPSIEGLVLTETAEGVTAGDIAARTGFAVKTADVLRSRLPLTPAEVSALASLRAAAAANRGS